MQHLDNDMDDLIWSASVSYPLRLPKDDWETIAGKLAASNNPLLISSKQKRKEKRRIVTVFVLSMIFMSVAIKLGDTHLRPVGRHNDQGGIMNTVVQGSKKRKLLFQDLEKIANTVPDKGQGMDGTVAGDLLYAIPIRPEGMAQHGIDIPSSDTIRGVSRA